MAGACNHQMSTSQQNLVPFTASNRNIKYMDEVEYQNTHYTTPTQSNGFTSSMLFRPKRSKSISSNVRDSIHPHSQVLPSMSTHNLNNHHQNALLSNGGFRTPQSNSNFKSKQALDAKFLALASSGLETLEPSPIANSDFLFRRLETIGSGSYATVYKTQNRVNGLFFALKEIKLQPQEGLPFTAIREVSLLRSVRHANIIQLFQIIHQPHALILVFEYMVCFVDVLMMMGLFRKRTFPNSWKTTNMVWTCFALAFYCSNCCVDSHIATTGKSFTEI